MNTEIASGRDIAKMMSAEKVLSVAVSAEATILSGGKLIHGRDAPFVKIEFQSGKTMLARLSDDVR